MKFKNLKIAYIGGGSRGWAWGLMSDLAKETEICGEVALYDIDPEAAKHNEIIGNKIKDLPECKSPWVYKAYENRSEALKGADFVIISILPGTFDEMESDVHAPEKYGIYQSVGDTSGPGGIIRALRTIPMYEDIALAIKENCPKAWVINYTNPMTVCTRTLYKAFPEIKAFGCCHEVFGTQKFLVNVLNEELGIEGAKRPDIKVNVLGVNHFTWLTSAQYKDIDIFPVYKKFCEKYAEDGYKKKSDENWMNNSFLSEEKVKMDLFKKFGYIAAAGDRHLAEFCSKKWYLDSPERVEEMHFGLTTVAYRKDDLKKRLDRSARLMSGEEKFVLNETGEDGVKQIKALLGLGDLITNVNMPNRGQIPNLPHDAVVETNAVFRDDSVAPLYAGNVPAEIYPLISRISAEQEIIAEAGRKRDLSLAYAAFVSDPLVDITFKESKALFDEMIENTKEYLKEYKC